ncbi:MAG TPA: dihydrodipicolinate synthase family protein [Acetobacteraceae bacterium]
MARSIAGLRGIVPPVVTPLTERFEVDFPSFTRVIEHLIAGGVHGLFFLGSTSEVIFHDEATRRAILEHAVRVTDGRVPILAGAVDPTTDRVIGHARAAASIGADGVVVTAPFYTRTSQPEVLDHFRYVAEDSPVPVVAYDLPVCVHYKLDRATVVTLAREGAIAGLKDSSGDDGNLRFVMQDLADRPDIFCMTGSEQVVDTVMLMGAHGAVPGLANVDPAGYVRIYDAAMRGDWAAARAEQERLLRLFEIIRCGVPRTSVGASGVGGFKTAMRALGIIATNTMARPQASLNRAEADRVEEILRGVGLLIPA